MSTDHSADGARVSAPGTRSHVHYFDPAEDVPVSTHVVEAVSNFVARDPVDLPVLNDAVDPDAVDAFLTPATVRSLEVSFSYAGCTVTVDNRGRVTVAEDAVGPRRR